ncbi:metacaspase-1-like [Mercurialis annua]|uniref:metacaspase-1-like n=1 Tax=Mercurialis annua TaxID=3986 RepID=UPI002160DBEA|nr:metacaspase-1-like [Mercurialis annua]
MVETRIIKCQSCQHHLWVRTGSETSRCVACKHINSVAGSEESSRTFQVRDRDCNSSKHSRGIPEVPLKFKRKRAVLCGVTYDSTKHKLKGTISDVKHMRDFLINNFKFPKDCIRLLTDEEYQDPKLIPTRKNIEMALQWLVEDCCPGDSLVFYFAGHGSQQTDIDEDEIDGHDEIICPLDFKVNGMIVDDYINSVIVRPLIDGVTLHAIMDTCHSATMLDLPHIFSANEKWADNNPPSGIYKGTSGGLAICISACRDDQLVVDSSTLCGKTTLTYNFIHEINRNPELTYGELVTSVQNKIHDAIEARGIKTWFMRTFFRSAFSQEVQLSSSHKFDIQQIRFKL